MDDQTDKQKPATHEYGKEGVESVASPGSETPSNDGEPDQLDENAQMQAADNLGASQKQGEEPEGPEGEEEQEDGEGGDEERGEGGRGVQDQAKEIAKEQAKKMAKKAVKQAAKQAIRSLVVNPYFWIVVGVILLVIFIYWIITMPEACAREPKDCILGTEETSSQNDKDARQYGEKARAESSPKPTTQPMPSN